jgi:hypothetical protein
MMNYRVIGLWDQIHLICRTRNQANFSSCPPAEEEETESNQEVSNPEHYIGVVFLDDNSKTCMQTFD